MEIVPCVICLGPLILLAAFAAFAPLLKWEKKDANQQNNDSSPPSDPPEN